MFRGSPGLTADQLADIGSIMGGDFNANTRESLTQYLFTVPSEDLDVALHIEALRMRARARPTPQGMGATSAAPSSRKWRRTCPTPATCCIEAAGAHVRRHALRTRCAGHAAVLRQDHARAMLKSFHDTWYAPNNAILVIVGNVDPQATLTEGAAAVRRHPGEEAAAQAAGAAATGSAPPPSRVDTDRPNGTLMIAMRVPGLHSPDFPALEVLADVLSSHRFDLYGLVPQGKAIGAEFALDPLPQAGLAYAVMSFPAGDDPKALEAEVRAILAACGAGRRAAGAGRGGQAAGACGRPSSRRTPSRTRLGLGGRRGALRPGLAR